MSKIPNKFETPSSLTSTPHGAGTLSRIQKEVKDTVEDALKRRQRQQEWLRQQKEQQRSMDNAPDWLVNPLPMTDKPTPKQKYWARVSQQMQGVLDGLTLEEQRLPLNDLRALIAKREEAKNMGNAASMGGGKSKLGKKHKSKQTKLLSKKYKRKRTNKTRKYRK